MTGEPILRDYLPAAIRRHGSRRAVVADGKTWTYADLDRASRAVAGYLDDLGVGPGDPVALILRNSAEYVVADLAIALLGAAKVPLNMMLSTEEQSYILADSKARVCLIEQDRLDVIEAARENGVDPHVVVRGGEPGAGSWDAAVNHAPLADEPAVPPDALALIMYTGGTTGRPKGVLHTQRGIAANLLSHLIEMELVAEDVLLLTSPLPHSAGFLLQAALSKGASVFVEPGFDIEGILDRISRDRVSYLFLVPTMIYRLIDAVAARGDVDTSSVRTILYGAAPISRERLEQGLRMFGPVFMQLYAQSEAPNFLTRLRRDDHRLDGGNVRRLTSCGQSVVMAQVEVRGEDGAPCKPGEVGEVVARSPYTMIGYLGLAAETAEALSDGWLHTGDLGYLDEDGYLYLVDRKKDMIITGGLNVYSTEVERALAQVPGVREAAVTGIPHPDWGEAVVAFVVPDRPDVTAEEIQEASREVLTSYKRPKRVVLVPSLPVTAVGKIDKKELRRSWPGW
ncbi:acyl-CoA synthetase [Actinomadura sp. NBRC 104412]|uniref:class I adenylate-forming enzyme family protein n=1 Tax=Actinomadura sp. NBRC 104412 TaxID=3032203 RepID=UPI0024A25273|nr:AMP-binding protein [Actinomadura sp. NBRC 104412]GLZ08414.1 acyl-CoA synthetase [Actinomadura sp. NBRC 104412]